MGWQDDPVVDNDWRKDPVVSSHELQAKEDSFGQNVLAGVGGAMAGIPLGLRQMVGKDKPGEVEDWKQAMAGLWSTPGGKIGTVGGGIATVAPAMFIPGVNTALGAGALGAASGLVQPVGEGESRLLNTAIGGGLGAAGQAGINKVGQVLANRATAKSAELATQQSQNAVRDGTLKAAQEAGYVFPPSQVNPSIPNRVAEGFAGKLTTAQQASAKNQKLTNAGVREDLSLPPEAALAKETLETVRSDAHAAGYKPLEAFGEIRADKPYAQRIVEMERNYKTSAGNMRNLRNPEVETTLQDAKQAAFDSGNVVGFLRNLREQGFANKSPMQDAKTRALGKVQIQVADAIEDLTERNLSRAGQAELLTNYREARKTIAKSFTAEKALNQGTGNIDAAKLARMFQSGKPLSGKMLDAAKAATAFPAAMRENLTSMPGLSPLDYMGGMLTGSAAGPAGLAATFARPVVRSGILSGPYQKAMVNPPSYELSALRKKLPHLMDSPLAGLLGASQVSTLLGRP